ncbi:MAG: putative membrane protein YecN with MAPEG domain [Paraglaciecola sp.]|jgi:uncharacterized membrane protein YecN with MAPEG domain
MQTPISAFYASLLALLFFYLTVLVITTRRSKKIGLGDGGDKHFQQYIRAHGNFSEYAPLVLIMLFIAEINGSSSLLLHVAGVCLLFGRFLHALGLIRHSGTSWQRLAGMILTFSALLGLAVLNLWMLF